jgi:hypothetical protein
LKWLNKLQQRFGLQHEGASQQVGSGTQHDGAASQPQPPPPPNSVNACASLAPANTNIAATKAAAIRNRLFMGRAPQSTKMQKLGSPHGPDGPDGFSEGVSATQSRKARAGPAKCWLLLSRAIVPANDAP